MRRIIMMILLLIMLFTGCKTSTINNNVEGNKEMKLYIDNEYVEVNWENNSSVEELKTLLPIEISLSKYGGFEQVGPIGKRITSSDKNMTTKPGDIVLYNSSNMVLFYGSNNWSYTKLGHMNLTNSELNELLGNKDVTIKIILE